MKKLLVATLLAIATSQASAAITKFTSVGTTEAGKEIMVTEGVYAADGKVRFGVKVVDNGRHVGTHKLIIDCNNQTLGADQARPVLNDIDSDSVGESLYSYFCKK